MQTIKSITWGSEKIQQFKSQWPCNHIEFESIMIEIDSAGNLVDIQAQDYEKADQSAILAMVQDMIDEESNRLR